MKLTWEALNLIQLFCHWIKEFKITNIFWQIILLYIHAIKRFFYYKYDSTTTVPCNPNSDVYLSYYNENKYTIIGFFIITLFVRLNARVGILLTRGKKRIAWGLGLKTSLTPPRYGYRFCLFLRFLNCSYSVIFFVFNLFISTRKR